MSASLFKAALFACAAATACAAGSPLEAPVAKDSPAPASLAREITEARSQWQAESANIRELLGKMKVLTGSLQASEDEVARLRRELRSLIEEKERTLDEMRQGLFCSGCGKTKSEILAAGDPFPHPNQRIIPADPARLKATEEDFDRRIAAAKKSLASSEARQNRDQPDLNKLHFEFMTRLPIYHGHFAREQELRMREWANEKEALETRIEELEKIVLAGEKELKDAKDSGEGRRLEAQRRTLQESLVKAREIVGRAQAQVNAANRQVEEAEAKLRVAVDDEERASLREALDRARRNHTYRLELARPYEEKLRKLEAEAPAAEQAAKNHTARIEAQETSVRILRRQFEDSLARARTTQGRAEQAAKGYVQAALKNLQDTAEVAKPLPEKFGLPGGWFISQEILNANPPVQCSIAALRAFDTGARGENLRGRLESSSPAPSSAPAAGGARKSMKDLLEGK